MIDMTSVTLSSKYQIVVPLDVREPLGLKPGAQLSVFRVGRMIQVVPMPTLVQLKTQLKGCGSDLPSEPDRY
jgi:AbrB family looped-hinge helix DNA binding protein